jgi:hypothetical protein
MDEIFGGTTDMSNIEDVGVAAQKQARQADEVEVVNPQTKA